MELKDLEVIDLRFWHLRLMDADADAGDVSERLVQESHASERQQTGGITVVDLFGNCFSAYAISTLALKHGKTVLCARQPPAKSLREDGN